MSDTGICFFVMRLSYSQVKPEELTALSGSDFKKVAAYVEQRRGLYLHRYLGALDTSRIKREKEVSSQTRVYSESEILTELGFNQ